MPVADSNSGDGGGVDALLRRERDALEAECVALRESLEEMTSAWAFESAELRSALEVSRSLAAALLDECRVHLPLAERGARAALEEQEAEESGVVQAVSLRARFLGRDPQGRRYDLIGRGLYDLWRHVRERPPAVSLPLLLASETHTTKLFFSVAGRAERWGHEMPELAPDDVNSFMADVVCALPSLRSLAVMALPGSLLTHCLAWARALPAGLSELWVPHAAYAAPHLVELAQCCPHLEELGVTASSCTDWGPYEKLDVEERRDRVDADCGNIIYWM